MAVTCLSVPWCRFCRQFCPVHNNIICVRSLKRKWRAHSFKRKLLYFGHRSSSNRPAQFQLKTYISRLEYIYRYSLVSSAGLYDFRGKDDALRGVKYLIHDRTAKLVDWCAKQSRYSRLLPLFAYFPDATGRSSFYSSRARVSVRVCG